MNSRGEFCGQKDDGGGKNGLRGGNLSFDRGGAGGSVGDAATDLARIPEGVRAASYRSRGNTTRGDRVRSGKLFAMRRRLRRTAGRG